MAAARTVTRFRVFLTSRVPQLLYPLVATRSYACTCVYVYTCAPCDAPLLSFSYRARRFLSPLSSCSRMMNNNRGTVARIYVGSVVPLIYEREPSPRPPWSVTIVRARAQVGKTGRGRVRFAFTETWLITARNSFSFR